MVYQVLLAMQIVRQMRAKRKLDRAVLFADAAFGLVFRKISRREIDNISHIRLCLISTVTPNFC